MKNIKTVPKIKFLNSTLFFLIGLALFTGIVLVNVTDAFANHPVLVEGNCNVPPTGSNSAQAIGTCGDYDGDSIIGDDEDNDGDRVFGTINGANSGLGVNNNGRITIVTSGTFPEVVTLAGNVVLEAAPGVTANIDAVLQGDAGSGARQGAPGIIVDAPANRRVIIKNIVTRNWTNGIDIRNASHVTISNSRIENNINFGILVSDNAVVSIKDSHITATGYRLNPATGDFPSDDFIPNPGIGISFDGSSSGVVANSKVSGSFGPGVSGNSDNPVDLINVTLFDNNNGEAVVDADDDDGGGCSLVNGNVNSGSAFANILVLIVPLITVLFFGIRRKKLVS